MGTEVLILSYPILFFGRARIGITQISDACDGRAEKAERSGMLRNGTGRIENCWLVMVAEAST